MKKRKVSISNPDELNKHLQRTSPITWISLGSVALLLIAFFVWSAVFKMRIKLNGEAIVDHGQVTLSLDKEDLNKLSVGQAFYINGKEGKIISFNSVDKQPVVSSFDLADGTYTDLVAIKRPIEFLVGK